MNDLVTFDNNANGKISAEQIREQLCDQETVNEIEHVVATYEIMLDARDYFERHSSNLVDMVRIMEILRHKFHTNPDVHDEVAKKLNQVLANNTGYGAIKKLVYLKFRNLPPEEEDHLIKCDAEFLSLRVMTEEERMLVLNSPNSISDAERTFSVQNNTVRPNRNRFSVKSVCQHMIISMFLKPPKVRFYFNFIQSFNVDRLLN